MSFLHINNTDVVTEVVHDALAAKSALHDADVVLNDVVRAPK